MTILDTNVISALMHGTEAGPVIAWLDRQPADSIWTSSVTLFELHYGLQIMPLGKRRAGMVEALEVVLRSIGERIAVFDDLAAVATANLMAGRHKRGRLRDLRDTMIAGIVLARRASLATRNVSHFDDLESRVVDPWEGS